MGMLDSILGSVLGGSGGASSPIGSILSSILGGNGGGLGGLLQQLGRAGHEEAANSWVGNGPNQRIDPNALGDALGRDRVDQWSRQTGMGSDDILHQLSNLLPDAVHRMTPEGRLPEGAQGGGAGGGTAGNPFEESPESDPFAGPGLRTGPR